MLDGSDALRQNYINSVLSSIKGERGRGAFFFECKGRNVAAAAVTTAAAGKVSAAVGIDPLLSSFFFFFFLYFFGLCCARRIAGN